MKAIKPTDSSKGVTYRLSSVASPHSNCRAEVEVKTIERLTTVHTGTQGSLDTDKFQSAMLQYRNPLSGTLAHPLPCALLEAPFETLSPFIQANSSLIPLGGRHSCPVRKH
ncbi:hypothetical protein PoB_001464200 [Plakobranchus ocellatus]|uniref:Uncharacterized protein n=1 Tax=Plakobranchus ocellatus TaxID=259542 RepID=A0AAV3Z0S3_9GAST|nr:hypothetical protein PoB_001464200 [Plakobranchus ocellatus]